MWIFMRLNWRLHWDMWKSGRLPILSVWFEVGRTQITVTVWQKINPSLYRGNCLVLEQIHVGLSAHDKTWRGLGTRPVNTTPKGTAHALSTCSDYIASGQGKRSGSSCKGQQQAQNMVFTSRSLHMTCLGNERIFFSEAFTYSNYKAYWVVYIK